MPYLSLLEMKVFKRLAHSIRQAQKHAIGWTNKLMTSKSASYATVQKHAQTTPIPASQAQLPVPTTNEQAHQRITRFWLYGAVTGIAMVLLYQTLSVITLILASYIISVAMEGPIRGIQKTGLRRVTALIVCYALFVVLLLAIVMVVPFVILQIGELLSMLFGVITAIQADVAQMGRESYIQTRNFLPGYFKDALLQGIKDPTIVAQLQAQLAALVGKSQNILSGVSLLALQVVTSLATIIANISLTIVMAIFFSIEKDVVLKFLVHVFAGKKDPTYVHSRVVTLYSKLQLWLKGQLFLMLYVGIISFVGLIVLGGLGVDIEKKWLLAIIAGVTEMIPYIGPMLGAIPAFLVAVVANGFSGGLAVIILFLIIQRTENNIVVPVVMNKVLGVNPLVMFLSALLGAWILGFVGILLAVPLAVIVTVVADKRFE